ncbi:spore germination protein [Salicibibacter cibarius]|uniref:Spore germination protein n=2 Tax=Salicibibacter cibarius TaxID=2743000 RepID=A0A7T7CDF9_9BACI|nr:spore germination protein [Salicibibacter cibarius]
MKKKHQQQMSQVLSGNLEESVRFIQDALGQNEDFVTRRFHVFGNFSAAMFYFSDMVDHMSINTDILKALMYEPPHLTAKNIKKEQLLDVLLNETIYHSDTELENQLTTLVQELLSGKSVVVIEGLDEALLIETSQREKRAIDEPKTEQVVVGPREGFIEQLGTNLSLLRYRLATPAFRVKTLKLGHLSQSKLAICYLEGTTDASLIEEVEKRLSYIDMDLIPDIGYVEQFIEDNKFSPFPQVQTTERPDKTIANLAEGRVALLLDGSPFALLLPVVWNQHYQTTEDYSNRFLMGSFIRTIRTLALVFALVTPSLYVAFISFHPELLPTDFAVAVASGRAGVPYPAVLEVLFMEIAMEVLREATIRLPTQVGGALSIIGVLIVGEAAVQAGLVSPITVVVIALATISSFATPSYSAAFALRMLRFPIIIFAGIFGLYGIVIGIVSIFNHMLSLKSFGVPYMSPVSPGDAQGWKDVVFRAPIWRQWKRPDFLRSPNQRRVDRKESEQMSNESNSTRD